VELLGTPRMRLGKRTPWSRSALARAAALVLSVLCLLGAASREAAAQYNQQGSKLVASDAVGNASQGQSVALSADGNTMIVGGFTDATNGTFAGAAWVYTSSGGVWTEQAKLLPSDATIEATFGSSVALSADGNTALVGGENYNGGIGAAWVFTRSGGTWTQQGAKLVASDEVGDGQFGTSVALSADGDTAIVGGFGDNADNGAAWIFSQSGGVWTQVGSKLVGTGAVNVPQGALQGYSVALSGDGNTAAVGGPADNRGAGATWVFTRSGGVWSQQGAKLAASGYSVALSGGVGNILLVGSGNTSVTASVFVRNGGVWTEFGSFTGTGYSGSTTFGTSVALSADGNTALLGSYSDNSDTGAAWVFTFNDGVWTQNGSKLVASDETGQGLFGYDVALSATAAPPPSAVPPTIRMPERRGCSSRRHRR
jgi:antibiotic biosynthesis monooxygenase (ABM) superfamily enzyme